MHRSRWLVPGVAVCAGLFLCCADDDGGGAAPDATGGAGGGTAGTGGASGTDASGGVGGFSGAADSGIGGSAGGGGNGGIGGSAGGAGNGGDPGATLFLRSSFNAGVAIVTRPTHVHEIRGTDSVTGFSWPSDLPGDPEQNFFNYVITDYTDYLSFVDTRIDEVTVRNSTATRALYMEFKRDDPTHSATSRDMYVVFGDNESTDPVQRMNQGYVKYKIKPHIEQGGVDWALPMDWKDTGDDGFRLGLYVGGADTGMWYWVAKGQYLIHGATGDNVWQYYNPAIPVPVDEWFDLEAYWYGHPDPSIGKLKVAINGEVAFDITDQTKDPAQPTKMFYFMPFKVYGAVGHSWITDFEYWSEPPTSSVLSGM